MNLAPSRRTLIIQPLPGIGDMVWHLPHLHAIAATTVSGQIDLLTKPRSQADRLLCADSTVERVLWLDRAAAHAGIRGLLRLTALLRQGDYQRVWILHGSARYALAARLAGIPERIGYGVGWQTVLLNGPVRLPPELRHAHPIQRADALLDLLNIPRPESEPHLLVAAAADQAVAERFTAWPLPWIALGIGSSEPCKQWGAARFAELALVAATAGRVSFHHRRIGGTRFGRRSAHADSRCWRSGGGCGGVAAGTDRSFISPLPRLPRQ